MARSKIDYLADVVINFVLFPVLTAFALFKSGFTPDILNTAMALSSVVLLVRVAILDVGLAQR